MTKKNKEFDDFQIGIDSTGRSIGVERIYYDENGKEFRVREREIPEMYPGEFDDFENVFAEIMMDVFFAPRPKETSPKTAKTKTKAKAKAK